MVHSNRHCVVITTTDSDELTKRISDAVVAKKLGACVQAMPISSVYMWKSEVSRDDENLLLIKTRLDLLDSIEALISEIHSYETPEIICIPIVGGSKAYLDWIDTETTEN